MNESATSPQYTPTTYAGGTVAIKSLAQLQEEDRRQAEQANAAPTITNLASHIKTRWSAMQTAKRMTVEPRLLNCLRQRRGEYDPERAALIKQQGGSDIYMMLSSNKARAASSWIRDVLSGAGEDKPWSVKPTPIADVPPERIQQAYAAMRRELEQALMVGLNPSEEDLQAWVDARRQMILNELNESAENAAKRMEAKIEDQLAEGGFEAEFHAFIDDLVTFPFAIMHGPVVKRRKTFKWAPSATGASALTVVDELIPTWERVDPFMFYWESHCATPDEGTIIHRHQLTREALSQLIGVEGYNEGAIRAVLDEYGRGGLREWLWVDAQKAVAEGKNLSTVMQNNDGLIDALKFMGSVQGKMLVEWGIDESEVEDPLLDYPVEAWLIGEWVIKATINPDPLGRKPYYKTSYEEIPGAWMGNSPLDLIRDCQNVCNAAARALVNNMGIASGPQVWVNIDRLPNGESVTQLFPWKIHQFQSDPLGAGAPPMGFFQPESLAAELMGIYEKFSTLADEYSGIPRYMTGDAAAPGAGRTATGLSMMLTNAGKTIKQVINNIDRRVLQPLIERAWFYNMKFSDDEEIKRGDVKIVARGANSLIVKDAAAQRRNELLQMALTNQTAQQIIGMEGTAQLLREQVKTLDMNADKIVPPPEVIKAKMAVAQAMAAQQAQMAPTPEQDRSPVANGNQQLNDGTPVATHFAPAPGG